MSTAQLGSLSSLSMPSSVPTMQVQKEPKAWEKALMGILAQVATTAATQGVGNAMSRDYADPTLGETKATGFDKLISGPKVTAQQNSQRISEKGANERQLAEGQLRIGLQSLADQPGPRDVMAKRDAEGLASDKRVADMRNVMAQSKLSRRDQGRADERELAHQDFELKRDAAGVKERAPLQAATIAGETARTEAQRTQNELMKRALGQNIDPKTGFTQKQTDNNSRAEALRMRDESRSAASATPSGLPAPEQSEMVRGLLAQGFTPEQIAALMSQPDIPTQAMSAPEDPKAVMQQFLQFIQQSTEKQRANNVLSGALQGSPTY